LAQDPPGPLALEPWCRVVMAKRGKEGPSKRTRAARPQAGAAASAPEPTAFGRYMVEGPLGEGSMGRVYRAFDPMAHRPVAIKTPKPEFCKGPEAEEYVTRFRREAQAAAGLSHPHIVTVFDVGQDYFVMELLEGVTLEALLAERGKLELSEALGILVRIAEAVDYAHAHGVVHRDIKPANICLLHDGRPKIMDFGVAHLLSAVITAGGQFLGSPAYMAPEQITNGQVSARSDLFSLAVVAYQMLTGRKPFEGQTISEVVYHVVNTDPAPPSAGGALTARYDPVFRRALAKDPSARFETATALVAALGRREADGVASGIAAAPPVASPADVETHDLKADDRRHLGPALPAFAKRIRWHRGRQALEVGALLVAAALALVVARGGSALWKSPAASLEVMTEPPNAIVRVDGLRVGRAPVTRARLTPGPHTVQVGLEGYAPAELTLEVQADALPVPIRFALQAVGGVLEVRSEPAGAEVRLDGRAVGATPVEGLSAPPGRHEVEIEARGYRPWRQTIVLNAGDKVPLKATLETAASAASAKRLKKLGWVRAGDLEALGPGVRPPRKLSGEPPPYPQAAKRLKLAGAVTVELTVTEEGEPVDLRVVRSGGELLDSSMIAAVRTWRYAPAEKNGVRVRVRIRAQERFRYAE